MPSRSSRWVAIFPQRVWWKLHARGLRIARGMDRLIDCLEMACSVPACMYAGVYMRAADNTDMNLFLVFRAGRRKPT
jgi:hypothetical protein